MLIISMLAVSAALTANIDVPETLALKLDKGKLELANIALQFQIVSEQQKQLQQAYSNKAAEQEGLKKEAQKSGQAGKTYDLVEAGGKWTLVERPQPQTDAAKTIQDKSINIKESK